MPTMASTNTQRTPWGMSSAWYFSSFSQPMSVSSPRRSTNGIDQNAVSSAPTTKIGAAYTSRRRSSRMSTSTTPPSMAKKAGMAWQRITSASSAAASARYRPVSRPRASTPKNSSASERLIEKLYSPASVDGMLPP